MNVLVTGADGFVGRWLVRALLEHGDSVTGAVRPGSTTISLFSDGERRAVRWVDLELGDTELTRRAVPAACDAVVHLAALASGAAALDDPGAAWAINAGGTARLLSELGKRRAADGQDILTLVVSTGEVYGAGPSRPLTEQDPVRPCSPYAASKLGAEVAAAEVARRTGLRVVVARAFPHAGPGQDERFVASAFARRLRGARLARARNVKVGNLEPVRDFLDVRDVAAAYRLLLERGVAGETYNVASGNGVSLRALFERLAAIVGVDAIPETDAQLVRPADIPYLVGDSRKLCAATGWAPSITLEETLSDLVNAQAD